MPYAIEVKAGKEYWLCVCGLSGTGLCNGSHKTTDKTPSQYKATKDETIYVCDCKKPKIAHFAMALITPFN